MKENTLTVQVDCSARELFDFTLNPSNTPKWVDDIVVEETNETPPRLGTIYRNQNPQGEWREFQLTTFEDGERFVLSQQNSAYRVEYTFKPLGNDRCELVYHEWVNEGELQNPVTQSFLDELKAVVEP